VDGPLIAAHKAVLARDRIHLRGRRIFTPKALGPDAGRLLEILPKDGAPLPPSCRGDHPLGHGTVVDFPDAAIGRRLFCAETVSRRKKTMISFCCNGFLLASPCPALPAPLPLPPAPLASPFPLHPSLPFPACLPTLFPSPPFFFTPLSAHHPPPCLLPCPLPPDPLPPYTFAPCPPLAFTPPSPAPPPLSCPPPASLYLPPFFCPSAPPLPSPPPLLSLPPPFFFFFFFSPACLPPFPPFA